MVGGMGVKMLKQIRVQEWKKGATIVVVVKEGQKGQREKGEGCGSSR